MLTDGLDSRDKVIDHKTAIFRQINKDKVATHHDALEFPDGRIALLTTLCEGQQATVLQLPERNQRLPLKLNPSGAWLT